MKRLSCCLVWFLVVVLPVVSFASSAGPHGNESRKVFLYPRLLKNPLLLKSFNHSTEKQPGHTGTSGELNVNSATVSTHSGAGGIRIEWSDFEGSLVKLELYRGDEFVEDISGWIENTGSFMLISGVLVFSTSEDLFCVRITDDSGDSAWSDSFLISSAIILTPEDVYLTGGEPAEVTIEWSGGSNPVCVELYRGEYLLGNLSGWIDNEGCFIWRTDVPNEWESSSNYHIRVSDTQKTLGRSDCFTVSQTQEPGLARILQVGEAVSGWFESPGGERFYRFNAKSLYAYKFCIESELEVEIEVLNLDGTVLYSSKTTPDDQQIHAEAAYWDCWNEGSYIARAIPLLPGETGDYTLLLDEVPGWQAAISLDQFPSQEGNVDYPGDVDYFVFDRTNEECTFEIKVKGNDQTVLFWVNTNDTQPEALVEGSEISILERYPGEGITETDSYYGISGSTGYYAVEGSVSKEGGISTWVIVGIVGGIVLILLCIKLVQEAEESCGSCSGLGLGDSSGLENLGCSGN